MSRARLPDVATLVWLASAGLLVLWIAAFHDLRVDDAFITFRYGQNLARGMGLVFNPNHRVMGSTSPGESLLSALVYGVAGFQATPGVMAALGCAGWIAQATVVFFVLEERLGRLRAGIVAAGVAVGAAGSAQWVALETNLAAAATLWAVALALRARWVPAAAACALAGLFRPDAYIACAPLAFLCVRELGRAAWRPALALTVLSAPWAVFATLYFGSPVPQSAVAKYHQTGAVAYALHVVRDVPAQTFAGMPAAGKVAFWGAVIAGGFVLVRAEARLGILLAYAAMHAAAYVALAPDPNFSWHLYPLTLVAVVSALTFLATLAGRLKGAPRLVAAVTIVAGCGVQSVAFARSHATDVWFGARDAAYRKVAAYLSAHADPGDIVDSEEVGTLAYYTDLRMNDHARLVTPYPGDVFWRLTHGRTTRLRWLVLNGAQMQLGREAPYYEGREMVLFREGGWGFYVVDIRAPRSDGMKSPWE
jgi:hypothetical protein